MSRSQVEWGNASPRDTWIERESSVKYSNLASLFGRQLFSAVFILSSANHFNAPTVEYAAHHGVPFAGVLVPLSGVIALVGGLSVLLGYQTRLGAWLLALFLVPVTIVMHNFWTVSDTSAFQVERALFLRNVALLGGALLIGYFGGGPLSLDVLIRRGRARVDRTRPPYLTPAMRASQPAGAAAASRRVLALSGSLQAQSKNLALLTAAAALLPPGIDVVLFDGIRDLPHFNPDIAESAMPDSVLRWRQVLADSDAVLIACPEYGFSLPGVLKNAIDWVIGTGELEGKVVAITAAVSGPERGRRGLQALRDTLSAVRASIVGGEPIPIGPEFERHVLMLVNDLIEAVGREDARRLPAGVPAQ